MLCPCAQVAGTGLKLILGSYVPSPDPGMESMSYRLFIKGLVERQPMESRRGLGAAFLKKDERACVGEVLRSVGLVKP